MERSELDVPGSRDAVFAAFTAKDWARIEDVPASTRAVGAMMRSEGERIGIGIETESSDARRPIDPRLYRLLCASAKLPTSAEDDEDGSARVLLSQQRSQKTHKEKKKNTSKLSVRAQQEERTAAADAARIDAVGDAAPRWQSYGDRIEAFVVSFRRWLERKSVCEVDRMVSCKNLLALLCSPALDAGDRGVAAVDVRLQAQSLVQGRSFKELLELAVEKEAALVSPSLGSGWAPLTLYPEQRQVAEAVLHALAGRLRAASLMADCDETTETTTSAPAALVRFCTPPSTGKSSAAAYIGVAVESFRAAAEAEGKTKARRALPRIFPNFAVYACYSQSVRFDVARACVAAALPFAIVTDSVACPSFSCYSQRPPRRKTGPPSGSAERVEHSLNLLYQCDRVPSVLVCDTKSATEFLSFRCAGQLPDPYLKAPDQPPAGKLPPRRHLGDVLLFDEPTADVGPTAAGEHIALLAVAPPITVMMSATLPLLSDMPSIVEDMRRRHPGLETIDVCSERVASPCTIVDAKGEVFAPHRVLRSPASVLCSILADNLHVRRLYSPRSVLQLVEDVEALPEQSSRSALDVVEATSPMVAFSFDGLRDAASKILLALPRDLVLCGKAAALAESYSVPVSEEMCTTGAWRYPGTTIVLSPGDPDAFWRKALAPLLRETEKLPKLLQTWRARKAEEKKRADAAASRHQGSRKRDGRHEDEKLSPELGRLQQAAEAAEEASSPWPARSCVNTRAHSLLHAAGKLAPVFFKAQPLVEEEVMDQSSLALTEALLSGVCPLNSAFADTQFALASIGMAEKSTSPLTYLCGGNAAVYGVNLPCDRVLIRMEGYKTALSSLIQGMGRAGRTGKFTRSEVLFADRSALLRACCHPAYSEEEDFTAFDARFADYRKAKTSSCCKI
jgi:hypothetical protein